MSLAEGSLVAPLDTNYVERLLRKVAVGRKNWLFAGSDEGAHRATIALTVLRSAALADVCDVWEYLRDILARLSSGWPAARLGELSPAAWVNRNDKTRPLSSPVPLSPLSLLSERVLRPASPVSVIAPRQCADRTRSGRCGLSGGYGSAASLEEVVANADARGLEDLGPQPRSSFGPENTDQ